MLNARVVDTSVASLMFKQDPLAARYRPHLSGALLVLSFQVVAEMRFGARLANWGERRRQHLESFILDFDILSYTDELSTHWAEIMAEAQRRGRRLEAGDAWVAATARYLNAPLVTHDRDFSQDACPSIRIIRVSG